MATPDPDVDRWLAERCWCRPGGRTRAVDLQVSWRRWCRRHGRDPGCTRHLVDQLGRRGYAPVRDGAGEVWIADLGLAPAVVDRAA